MRISSLLFFGIGLALIMTSEAQAQGPSAPTVLDAGLEASLEVPELVEVKIRHGESLYDLARWSGVEIESLETLNDIRMDDPLKGGHRIIIPLTKSALTNLKRVRHAASERRKGRYLRRRGGLVEVKAYRIRTRDTVWGIAKKNGRLPIWLVKAYNPKVNLNRVKIGQSLQIPILGDTIKAEPPTKKTEAKAESDEIDPLHPDHEDGC